MPARTETVVVLTDDTDGSELRLEARVPPVEEDPPARWKIEGPGAPVYATTETLLRFLELARVAVARDDTVED